MANAAQRPRFYGTSDAARLVGCAEDTLKRYAKAGVVNPERTASGRRIFTDADIVAARAHHKRNRQR